MKKSVVTLLALVVSTLFAAESFARDQINIVGSSTVYPYGTVNAQRLGESGFKTPTYNSFSLVSDTANAKSNQA